MNVLLDISTSAPSNWIQIVTLLIVALMLCLMIFPYFHR